MHIGQPVVKPVYHDTGSIPNDAACRVGKSFKTKRMHRWDPATGGICIRVELNFSKQNSKIQVAYRVQNNPYGVKPVVDVTGWLQGSQAAQIVSEIVAVSESDMLGIFKSFKWM